MNADRLLLWFIFAIAAISLAFAFYSERSSAAFTFNSSVGAGTNAIPSFDLRKLNLPQPLVDFINGIRGVNEDIAHAKLPSYPAGSSISGPFGWLDAFFRNIPLVSQLYSIIVRIITLIGHLLIWILQLLIDVITKGLSYLPYLR